MEDFDNRRFVTLGVSEINQLDFDQIFETSPQTLRKSVDETLVVVKFDLPTPSSILQLTTKSQEYTYSEIYSLMQTPAWYKPRQPENA
jgi:hypothetical protein